MNNVKFIVTEITDHRKKGSEVEISAVLIGELSDNEKSIYFKDKADVDWIFYVGDTCELYPQEIVSNQEQLKNEIPDDFMELGSKINLEI